MASGNPGYVDVVLRSYRHRLGFAPGNPRYEEMERRLAAQPAITVPAVTLDGRRTATSPRRTAPPPRITFTAPRRHHQVPDAGHNLPQEAPDAFAGAVLELATF